MAGNRISLYLLAVLFVGAHFPSASPLRAQDAAATVLAVGDIARCRDPWWAKAVEPLWDAYPDSRAAETAALVDRLAGTVLALGDLVYYEREPGDYRHCYDATWGRHRERTRPVPGNHDDRDDGAAYFAYWGPRAGETGHGYYSFDLGAWHLIALNSNIDLGPDSDQGRWLRADLAATRARCILAYWHHPLFTSGRHHADDRAAPLYRMLHKAGASIVLNGHGHNYERFAPQDADGRRDPKHGIRSFVVGTGGVSLRGIVRHKRHSEAFNSEAWGVLQLELHEDRYAWRFIPIEGGTFTDSGAADCVERRGN
ncbi:MAG: metallophosphoesterase [Rhodospirillales bacterium]|nr:metallophosphoesterase [Rhodospirillales bacterium]